ncbi:pogo transposable element with KRAB domain-like protein [Aphelenchoides avenae]|nr:pogo transposable element with KRAB domain-like protein [Aphelenchus avenae]
MGAKREARLDWTDETAIAMGGNGGLTIEEIVPISSTGHEETNVAVMLTAASDGTPLKPTFKAKYRELYDNWIWIVEVWKSIPHEALAASFKTRGIATAADGNEPKPKPNHLIHCTKPNGPIQSGRTALEKARILDGAALEEALLLDDEDAALLNV